MKEKIKTELIIWAQYLLIFIATCLVVSFIKEIIKERNRRVAEIEISAIISRDGNINFNGTLNQIWNEYFYWYLLVFLSLCAVRLLFVWLYYRKKESKIS